jgi:hypothetical protein
MPVISRCIASHFPPPANAGGGASLTALTTAITWLAGLGGSRISHPSAGLRPSGAVKNPSRHGRLAGFGNGPSRSLEVLAT